MFSLRGPVVLQVLITLTSAGPIFHRQNGSMVYDFSELTASSKLTWTPCFDDFTCTLLEVPLDYTNTSAGTANIAFIKKSTGNPEAQDVLINPGGPSGSGVDFLLTSHKALATRLGPQFNIVGFDPRGVNNSGPSLECFPGAEAENTIFDREVYTPIDTTSSFALHRSFERAKMFGNWCSPILAVNETAKYANTVAVANDLLRYVELDAEARGQAAKEGRLMFYGLSYGTILGATYASLFPDRIERMILDGVGDTEDYYLHGWKEFVVDFDDALGTFFTSCFDAGPELCAFHQNASSPADLKARFQAISDSLRKSPIGVADPLSGTAPLLLTWERFMQSLFVMPYSPSAYFPLLSQVLLDLEKGNASLFAAPLVKDLVHNTPKYDEQDPRGIISCLDVAGRLKLGAFEKFEAHVQEMIKISHYGGPTLAAIVGTPCLAFDLMPPESQIFPGKASANHTSNPILFVSAKLDPITPLRHAKKMSSQFNGSRVLEVAITGHSSFGAISNCTDNYFHAYMDSASLPPPEIICDAEFSPFASKTASNSNLVRRGLF